MLAKLFKKPNAMQRQMENGDQLRSLLAERTQLELELQRSHSMEILEKLVKIDEKLFYEFNVSKHPNPRLRFLVTVVKNGTTIWSKHYAARNYLQAFGMMLDDTNLTAHPDTTTVDYAKEVREVSVKIA
jgi:hypothetical protein